MLCSGYWQKISGVRLTFRKKLQYVSPKISKGENYLGLPYVMFDYPRYFSAEDIIGCTMFFLVGKFFQYYPSPEGPVPGEYLLMLFSASILFLSAHGYSLAISEDEWQHHFGR